MAGHRWSGWPGAWCLDCGVEDPNERCLAKHGGHVALDDHEGFTTCDEFVVAVECPEPNSRRHDPYAKVDPETQA